MSGVSTVASTQSLAFCACAAAAARAMSVTFREGRVLQRAPVSCLQRVHCEVTVREIVTFSVQDAFSKSVQIS